MLSLCRHAVHQDEQIPQAWELRMEKSAEKWGPRKAPSGGPGGNAFSGGQGAKPPEAEAEGF